MRVTGAPTKLLLAMQEVGWFVQTSQGVCFPDYEENMSASAKKRALAAKRKQKQRAGEEVSRSARDKSVTRKEKRRVEEGEPQTLQGRSRATVEEVREYCKVRGNSVDPERFVDYYQSQDWRKANG